MGKVKSGKKIYESLSKVVKGLDKADAEKVLAKIDTPEEAVALTGDARAEYLKALDTVYGPQAERAAGMGFGPQTLYHGSPSPDIEFFNPSLANSARKTGVPENAVVLTDNPRTASSYANEYTTMTGKADYGDAGTVYPVQIKPGKQKKFNAKGENWNDIYDPKTNEVYSTNDLIQIGKDANKNSVAIKNVKDFGAGIGKDAVPATTIAVFDPSQIRSKFAAFDPRFKDSPLLMAGTAGAVMGTTMLPEESEASMGKFNSLKKMWQVGDKAFPAANAAEALKVQKAMETKGMVPHGKVLVEAKGTVPVANKPISNMARGIAVPGALGIDSTGSDVLKSGMQGVLDAFGAYRQNIVEPVANKLKETLTPKLNIQGQQYDTASPVSDMALDIAADPLTYAGGGAGAGLGALDMATSFGEESPKRNYEGLKAILNKK